MTKQSEWELVQFAAVAGDPRLVEFNGMACAHENLVPGTQLLLVRRRGVAEARASLFTVDDLTDAPGLSGLIGHYEALTAESARVLLDAATAHLRALGVLRILGPMNGSTWQRYRFALGADVGAVATDSTALRAAPVDTPWFTGEPTNPFTYPAQWQAAGFVPVLRYESRIERLPELSPSSPPLPMSTPSAEDAGSSPVPNVHVASTQLRTINLDAFDDELATLHAISCDAFTGNSFYSPITLHEFRSLYAPFRDRLDPRFVLIATSLADVPLGFLFAYPDPLSVRNGRADRLIMKTLAVATVARGQGVASLLLDRVRAQAAELGFRELISALMHEDNTSRGMAERRASTLWRQYALYERVL